MRHMLAIVALLSASPALAQAVPQATSVDLSPIQAQIKAAQQAAQTATDLASAAQSAAASKCAATPVVPSMEVVGGSAGTSGVGCRPVNSVQPRITRSVAFTTGSGGTVAVTWADMGAVPLVFPIPNIASGATQGPVCYPVSGTVTSTGATLKCFTTQSVTVSLLGSVVAPITTAGAGVTGQVLAIPVS